jgi:hypothetical protein
MDPFDSASVEAGVYRFKATGALCYNDRTVAGDRATQECDLSTAAVPYGAGSVPYWCRPCYKHAGGDKAINSKAQQ